MESANHILLRGSLHMLPEKSHDNHGRQFYRFLLEVPRLSGAVDILPVIAEESILNRIDLCGGQMLTVSGQIRSHNIHEEGRRRLLVFVFASEILAEEGPAINDVTLNAVVCREPNYRHTPLGRQICDVMTAVPRTSHRADYLPCIFWGRIAQEVSQCQIGDCIRIQGRLQSRVYTKMTAQGAQERTTYEVSVLTAEFPEELY